MTLKKTNLSNGKRGLRCQVCTGCGLCPGVVREGKAPLRVLSEDLLGNAPLSLANVDGIRLIAADVGTTTIAMELYAADGSVEDRFVCVNPQTEFGSDVLSRVTAARDPETKNKMMEMVRSALRRGAERFLKCLREGEMAVCVIAANTVMSYLLMGWDAQELGQAPFRATHLAGARFLLNVGVWQDDMAGAGHDVDEAGAGHNVDEAGAGRTLEIPCLLVPGFSAFVGADLLAGAIACGMAETDQTTLLVDLGTNGEILLGSRKEILATATAAGPAFEGGPNRGIWGADLVKFAARLLDEGIMDETGLLAEPYFEEGIRIGNVKLTQESIRSLQLAKAAIRAGIQTLVREKGISTENVDRVILAGGFGYFLDPADAVRIGLLPESLEHKAIPGGNTALAGAKRIGSRLLNRSFWEKEGSWTQNPFIESTNVRVINLAAQPEFEECYVDAMAFHPAK